MKDKQTLTHIYILENYSEKNLCLLCKHKKICKSYNNIPSCYVITECKNYEKRQKLKGIWLFKKGEISNEY